MTDHWRGLVEQQAQDHARIKDERDRLRAQNSDLRAQLDVLQAAALDLRAQLAEAQVTIRALVGVPNPGDPPTGGPR